MCKWNRELTFINAMRLNYIIKCRLFVNQVLKATISCIINNLQNDIKCSLMALYTAGQNGTRFLAIKKGKSLVIQMVTTI